jgi:hypothetical protein
VHPAHGGSRVHPTAEHERETVPERCSPNVPVQPEEGSPPITNLVLGSQFEITFDYLYAIPKLGAPRQDIDREEIPIS